MTDVVQFLREPMGGYLVRLWLNHDNGEAISFQWIVSSLGAAEAVRTEVDRVLKMLHDANFLRTAEGPMWELCEISLDIREEWK